MGGCLSKKGESLTQGIDDELRQDKMKMKKEIKLLLLGTGESGKSTIFKQMKIIHDSGFTEAEKRSYIAIILKHTIENFHNLCEGARDLGFVSDEQELEVQGIIKRIETEGISNECAHLMLNVWHSPSIQQAFTQRQSFHLPDSAKHFMDNINRIIEPGYLPTHEDILACRVRTTGVSEMAFDIDTVHFRLKY
eukprot:c13072_g2_i2.p1 GENE.c13072_g2_i2~~c13072_g2_i2.p1  ORF type:complete len:193 (-),score=49.07 c13072_g2_i2:88-666(-)